MFRVLVFGLVSLAVFYGMANVFPLLETPIVEEQILVAAGAGARTPSVWEGEAQGAVPRKLLRPTCIISAHPSVISRGESVNIAWGSENASSASLSGIGAVRPRGGLSVRPVHSGPYVLTVHTPEGRTSFCRTWVSVR